MEIYKLQVTQYGHSEYDNTDSKSDFSMNSNPITKTSLNDDSLSKPKPSTSFELPIESASIPRTRIRSPGSTGNLSEKPVKFNPSETKKSLVSVGRSVV